MAKLLAMFAVLAALGLAACGGDDDEGETSSSEPAATEQAADATASPAASGGGGGKGGGGVEGGGGTGGPAGIEITTAESQYGQVLFDSQERAIYFFDKESGPTSECYGECASAWPPVLTEGDPQAGGEVDAKLLGTTERDDGTMQVTYADRPLYYYVDDPPGEVLCHNVDEFGGLWLAVEPSGEAVR